MPNQYVVISDIHGNAGALKKALACYRKQQEQDDSTGLILLGDLYYHGPRNPIPDDYETMETVRLLNELAPHITAVGGNCDAEIDEELSAFTMARPLREIKLLSRRVVLSHGHYNSFLFHLMPGDVLLSGHTHLLQAEKSEEGIFFLNPGSVGIPKGGNPASYGILNENGFVIKDFEGNILKQICFA